MTLNVSSAVGINVYRL